MNGLVFMLIGLQLPSITQQLGDVGISAAIGYGLAISGVLMIARFLCSFGAVGVTRFMSRFITVADPNPDYKAPLIFGWAGMRGVVSLAAALSIPLLVGEEQAFPHRNLILFVTFIVIIVTLVGQGLTLPWIIKKMNLKDRFATLSESEQEEMIQSQITQASVQHLTEKYSDELKANPYLINLMERLQLEFKQSQPDTDSPDKPNRIVEESYQRIYLDILDQQRLQVAELNRQAVFSDELIRKYLALIDLEELRIREKILTPET